MGNLYRHLDLRISAKVRLAMLRETAAKFSTQPVIWRDMRFARFDSCSGMGLSQGSNSDGKVWTSFTDAFPSRDASDIIRMGHTGWYSDAEGQDGLVIGIVVKFPHGRYIAGYRWETNGERVYYPELFDSADDAARMADEHARVYAETESAYQERWRAANRISDKIDDKLAKLREQLALRNHKCFPKARQSAQLLIAKVRDLRETLETEYADVAL